MSKMIEEWHFQIRQSEALCEEAIELRLQAPKARALEMAKSDLTEIRSALYCIREENNYLKIILNREYFRRHVQEFVNDGNERQTNIFSSILYSHECSSDIEISDEEI